MRSPRRQAWGSRGDPFAQRRTRRPFQQQDSQRARSGDDARAGRVAKSQRYAGVIVNRQRCARASDGACERREMLERRGGSEQVGGGVQREHAPR